MGKFNYFIYKRSLKTPFESKLTNFVYKEKRLNKFSKDEQEDLVFDLINAFALANNPLDSALLLQDLLTESEVKNLAKRLGIAKLLLSGNTHEDIVEELHCSFATVSKVRIWLDNAGDGLKKIIKKLRQRREVLRPKRTPGIGYGLPDILAYYVESTLKANEDNRLKKFLGNMKGKAASDKDYRGEVNEGFRNLKSRKI